MVFCDIPVLSRNSKTPCYRTRLGTASGEKDLKTSEASEVHWDITSPMTVRSWLIFGGSLGSFLLGLVQTWELRSNRESVQAEEKGEILARIQLSSGRAQLSAKLVKERAEDGTAGSLVCHWATLSMWAAHFPALSLLSAQTAYSTGQDQVSATQGTKDPWTA